MLVLQQPLSDNAAVASVAAVALSVMAGTPLESKESPFQVGNVGRHPASSPHDLHPSLTLCKTFHNSLCASISLHQCNPFLVPFVSSRSHAFSSAIVSAGPGRQQRRGPSQSSRSPVATGTRPGRTPQRTGRRSVANHSVRLSDAGLLALESSTAF